MSWQLEGRTLRSILISRLRYLGDVVMATPLLEVLRRGDPDVHLGFLAEKGHGMVLQGHPHLDQLHLLETQRRGSDAKARIDNVQAVSLPSYTPGEMVSQLQSCQYDLAVDLFFNPRSAWLLRLSGIGKRISGTAGSRRLLYSHNIIPSQNPEQFQGLFQLASGGMGEHLARLQPLIHEESGLGFLQWFESEFADTNPSPFLPLDYWKTKAPEDLPGDLIVMAPGATWPVKEWPFEHWQKLIGLILSQTKRPVFVIQPPGAENPWAELAKEIPSGRGGVLPPLGLSAVLGVISHASLMVSVDGGVMHASVGLGIPTVALFGPTDDTLWFPYTRSGPYCVLTSQAPCSPCDLHQCDDFICLPRLSPQQVWESCLELLPES